VEATSSQKLCKVTASAHRAAVTIATSKPIWKERLRPSRACRRDTGMADSAAPTT
jgi:hypothetical protein